MLSLKSRNPVSTNVSSFNDSLVNFRKDVNPMQFKSTDYSSWDTGKWSNNDFNSKPKGNKSPTRRI